MDLMAFHRLEFVVLNATPAVATIDTEDGVALETEDGVELEFTPTPTIETEDGVALETEDGTELE